MERSIIGSVISFGLLIGLSSVADANSWRITCTGFEGARVFYTENPAASRAEGYFSETIGNDKISGLRMEIVYSDQKDDAAVLLANNINVDNEAYNYKAVRIAAESGAQFVWRDERGGMNWLSYYPKLKRSLYSIHNDRLGWVDMTLVGKIFYAQCGSGEIK